MLKQLNIQNIILVESAQIAFEKGLNVLSGETGSGKSALINSLSLIAGERADVGMIRRGAEKGVVEAVFDIDALPQVIQALHDAGIDHASDEELIIRREIATNGKSRAFINNQMAQVGLLRTLTGYILEMVGQHANQKLLSLDNHREMVDLFGNLDARPFAQSWREENDLRTQLHELTHSETERLREIERYRVELDELQAAHLQENEEEELFKEYTLLSNAEERITKVAEILQMLSGERNAVLALLNRQNTTLEQLAQIDPSLSDTLQSYSNARLELQEVAHTLRNYQTRIEHNPERLATINERLTLIDKLKRRYGTSFADIHTYQMQITAKLQAFEQGDSHIETLRQRLEKLVAQNNIDAQQLTKKRQVAARALEQAVIDELRHLNMAKAQFHCQLSPQPRNRHGDDRLEFFLTPNIGEHPIAIKECASGGELSRVMLALQTLLAGKEKIPTLIFDEIDANIGGATASVIGEKLKAIGQQHQVLCITHFPQVAKQADHHLQISKEELGGRTVTTVRRLDAPSRKQELARMSGIDTNR